MGASAKISRTQNPSQFAFGPNDSDREENKSETLDLDFDFNLDNGIKKSSEAPSPPAADKIFKKN